MINKEKPLFSLNANGTLHTFKQAAIMGILNVTPDSFYDGSVHNELSNAVEHTAQMLGEGASIIDVGGASSRPNAASVSIQEEMDRVLPVIEQLRATFPGILLSVDTFHAKVAQAAIELGAGIVNDISGGNMDSNMFSYVSSVKVPYVLMHMQGTPQTMQDNPKYDDVVLDILKELSLKIYLLEKKGCTDIIIDMGFGFGKTIAQNYTLLNHLHLFKKSLQKPILVGISRKSMLYKPLKTTPQDSLPATTATHVIALQQGADILRVHDVKAAKQAIEIVALSQQFI